MRSRFSDQRGVTAAELMVVLVLVAILSIAAYPMLQNIRQILMVKGAAEQTAGAIRLARQFAITQGTNFCIEFQGGPPATQYRIRQADSTPDCNGTVVNGYDWKDLSDSPWGTGTVVTTAPTLAFDPVGNRILPSGAGVTTFTVDTSPTSCVSTITVTLYGGLRVAAC